MTTSNLLPKTGDAQDIGADAEVCFIARKSKDWRAQNLAGTDDYGLDFQIQTTPNQQVTDIFRVQLKGTRSPEYSSDRSFISMQLSTSTVRYYKRIKEPILLVVCDLSVAEDPVDCHLYYVWVRDELKRLKIDLLPDNQASVTFRVPTANRLTRTTDLSDEIRQVNELSNVGHALEMKVEQMLPGMQMEERLHLVKRIESGITSRAPSFIDALSSEPNQHWPEPKQDTLAWSLVEAKKFLQAGKPEKAEPVLISAFHLQETATQLERSEYFYLRGRCRTQSGDDSGSIEHYSLSKEIHRSEKNLSSWAEAVLRDRYVVGEENDFSDIIGKLSTYEPKVLSIKARLLGAEHKYDEAIELAQSFTGEDSEAAQAVIYTMFGKPVDALKACQAGLSLPNLTDSTKQLLLVLKARANFSKLTATAQFEHRSRDRDTYIPPTGYADFDIDLARETWTCVEHALESLQDNGWSNNVDFLADIWAATASMLGKQNQVLSVLESVARLKPHLQNVQSALEGLSAQCGEFSIALEANGRLNSSSAKNLRRTLLLHESGKHRDCIRHFESELPNIEKSHVLFGPAITTAVVSAHKLSRTELVIEWTKTLSEMPNMSEHSAILDFLIAMEVSRLGKDAALAKLVEKYAELNRPLSIAVTLLQELDPTNADQAKLCIDIGERVQEFVQPSSSMAIQIGFALATLESWPAMLAHCQKFKSRIEPRPRMLAFEALALDKLGRTSEAKDLLEQMLDGGISDAMALNTYVAIMSRCGFIDEAIDATERILEAATLSRQQMDCTRLLFNLVQASNPTSPRLLQFASKMGQLSDPSHEAQEGVYLVMFLIATMGEISNPTPAQVAEFHRRAEQFFARFPESKIIRRAETDPGASPSEFLDLIKKVSGITEDQESFQRKLENKLQQGALPIPFTWRPRLVFSSIRDVVHLWEVAKASSTDDKKYHLDMLQGADWQPVGLAAIRQKPPLLDLISLVVLYDLNLLEKAIGFFKTIAISQATILELAKLSHPFTGSYARNKCDAIQKVLKLNFGSILQPSFQAKESNDSEDDEPLFGTATQEIKGLAAEQRFHLYSDDLAFRIFCSNGNAPMGICTADVICALEEAGEISPYEASTAFSMLCGWRVGVAVLFRHQIAAIPNQLLSARTINQGLEILDQASTFKVMMNALWDHKADLNKTFTHVSGVLRGLADSDIHDVAIASIIGVWYIKTKLVANAPHPPVRILTRLFVLAAVNGHTMSVETSRKLWALYQSLVEFEYGDQMDSAKERQAVHVMGVECAEYDHQHNSAPVQVKKWLENGLTPGVSTHDIFCRGYSETLIVLKKKEA